MSTVAGFATNEKFRSAFLAGERNLMSERPSLELVRCKIALQVCEVSRFWFKRMHDATGELWLSGDNETDESDIGADVEERVTCPQVRENALKE